MEPATEVKAGKRYFVVAKAKPGMMYSGIVMRKNVRTDRFLGEHDVKLKDVSTINPTTGVETPNDKKFSVQQFNTMTWTFFERK